MCERYMLFSKLQRSIMNYLKTDQEIYHLQSESKLQLDKLLNKYLELEKYKSEIGSYSVQLLKLGITMEKLEYLWRDTILLYKRTIDEKEKVNA